MLRWDNGKFQLDSNNIQEFSSRIKRRSNVWWLSLEGARVFCPPSNTFNPAGIKEGDPPGVGCHRYHEPIDSVYTRRPFIGHVHFMVRHQPISAADHFVSPWSAFRTLTSKKNSLFNAVIEAGLCVAALRCLLMWFITDETMDRLKKEKKNGVIVKDVVIVTSDRNG